MKKKVLKKSALLGLWCIFYSLLSAYVYAGEVAIFYTGDTHGMLYQCSCPKEPDGGVARRAALVKQLRKGYPQALLLDSGNFFAGGLLDEYTQNTQLDMQRTKVALKAMELMKYDAVAIGPDEFNFGSDFLRENINESKLAFLSSNILASGAAGGDKILPYIIKEASGARLGIIAVTNPIAKQKAGGFNFLDLKDALQRLISELKGKADIIVVLSNLSEEDNLSLASDIGSIDILIGGHSQKEARERKVGSTLFLNSSWQGRKLGVLSLNLSEGRIENYKVELLRLSDKIKNDQEIENILPVCFSDLNCKKEASIGVCQNPGALNARCQFSEASKIKLLILNTSDCQTCYTETTVNLLKTQFPGIEVSYLSDKKASALIKKLSISSLPAYLLGKEIEKEKNFSLLKPSIELKGDFYLLKPQVSGVSYFLNREKIKGRLDLFISLYDKSTPELLDAIKDFNPEVHFLAVEEKGKFDAAGGGLEVEEYLRAVCIQKDYPAEFFNYITCRSRDKESSWWDDCASKSNIDTEKVRTCARGEKGALLLKENISLNKKLQVMFGPTYLVDNQEIFGSKGVPKKEDLKKLFKR